MCANVNFYAELPVFTDFTGICNLDNYTQLPDDWAIIITDIKGSTEAIHNGQYRAVNAVGVASIIAILNAVKPLSIPFVFGGDGASLCIPQSCIEKVENVLVATQQMAARDFSLALRCAIVPSALVQQSEQQILIAKHQVSKGYYQACFIGNGLIYAEKLVKNDPQGVFRISIDNKKACADFSGFECRWKDIPSPHEETVSLLVMSMTDTVDHSVNIYRDVLAEIEQIYGHAESYKPVHKRQLELATRSQDLQDEVKIRAGSRSKFGRLMYAIGLPWIVRLGRFLMDKEIQSQATDWGGYKETLVANTDFRKIDDNLRMVISGNAKQRQQLERYLAGKKHQGLLVYGMHVSNRALMTCIISDYNLNHIHFVDGADGGYAMAAKILKQQLQTGS